RRALLANEGQYHAVEEHQHAETGNIRADRRDEIPPGERIRIVDVATRHAREAEEVLREEGQIDANESEPEMQLADGLAVHVAGHFREPVIPAAENGEDRAERKHVVKVRDDIIGAVQDAIDASIGEHDAGDAADGEQENE